MDKTVRLWSMPMGEPRAVLLDHTSCVYAVRFCPRAHDANDGGLFSAGEDGLRFTPTRDLEAAEVKYTAQALADKLERERIGLALKEKREREAAELVLRLAAEAEAKAERNAKLLWQEYSELPKAAVVARAGSKAGHASSDTPDPDGDGDNDGASTSVVLASTAPLPPGKQSSFGFSLGLGTAVSSLLGHFGSKTEKLHATSNKRVARNRCADLVNGIDLYQLPLMVENPTYNKFSINR